MKIQFPTIFFVCAALWLLVWPVAGAPGALRLGGTFMQYQDEMQTWSPYTWSLALERMKQLRMDTIIVQMLVQENNDGTTHSFIGPTGQTDATEAILDHADANGLKVFLGTYSPNWNHDMTNRTQAFAWCSPSGRSGNGVLRAAGCRASLACARVSLLPGRCVPNGGACAPADWCRPWRNKSLRRITGRTPAAIRAREQRSTSHASRQK